MNALLVLMTAPPTLTVPTLWAHLIAFVKPDILEMAYLVPVGNVKMASTVENICKKNQDCCLIKKRCMQSRLIELSKAKGYPLQKQVETCSILPSVYSHRRQS